MPVISVYLLHSIDYDSILLFSYLIFVMIMTMTMIIAVGLRYGILC